jgi:hypothetical protein
MSVPKDIALEKALEDKTGLQDPELYPTSASPKAILK